MRIRLLSPWFVPLVYLVSCGSTPQPPAGDGAETVEWARSIMTSGHYRAAADELDKLVLNFPDREFSGEAQYLLGEAHMAMKEFILAESAFRMLLNSYPGSPYRDDAELGIAICFARQASRYQLDQTATGSAVRALERFMEDNPRSPLLPTARAELYDCRERLALKLLDTARHYFKRKRYDSARLYLDEVRATYPSTKSAIEARFLEAKCEEKQGELERAAVEYAELLDALDENDPLSEEVAKSLREIRKKLSKES